MFSMKSNNFVQIIILLIPLLYAQGCAVLTQSQVDAVGDFAMAADNYSDLPGSVIEMHANAMLAENIYSIASLTRDPNDPIDPNDPHPAPKQISKKVSNYLDFIKKSAEADAALDVIDTYVKLLTKLTSNDFTEKLQEEAASLGTEIDGAVNQYNAVTGESLDSFGAAVTAIVRAGGGIIIQYKQAKALKKAVDSAEPVIEKMSKSVTDLMNSYIGVIDEDGNPLKGLGQEVEEGLVDEYLGLLNSHKSNNSVQDVQNVAQLLLKAKSIKPLAEKTKKAMLTFEAAHTKLYDKLQERQALKGTIEEIKVLYGEIKSAQKLKKEIEN